MSDKLVIFDCDGVLVDSEIISCRIACEEFNKQGFEISYESYINSFSGKSRASVIMHVESTSGILLPKNFSDKLEQKILESFNQNLKPISDINRAIEQSPNRCIASGSSLKRIHQSLTLTGLNSYFNLKQIFSSSMVKHGKPDPDLFLLASKKMGFVPNNCWVIEDSIAGVNAAKKANMHCIGFTGGSHIIDEERSAKMLEIGVEKVFSSMSDLAVFLSKISTV